MTTSRAPGAGRAPGLTMVLVGLTLVVWALPDLAALVAYERAAILDGQVWRLVTAPLAHLSTEHLVWNLVLVVAAGVLAELSGYRHLGLALLLGGVVPGLSFLALRPGLEVYGGLSGVATAAVTYVALCRLAGTADRRARAMWLALVVLVLAKPLAEVVTGGPLFASTDHGTWRVLPEAHGLGFAAGLVAAWLTQRRGPEGS